MDELDLGQVLGEWGVYFLGARRAARLAGLFLQQGIALGLEPTAGPHAYVVVTDICQTSTPGCTVEAVFERLRRYPVKGHALPQPGQPDPCAGEPRSTCEVPVQTDDFTMVEVYEWPNIRDDLGPVRHVVDPETHTVSNITEEGHVFDPGEVTRTVYIDNGYVKIGTLGEGTGDYPLLNQVVGASVFKTIDNEIKAKIGAALGAPAP
jgi:hypothetical protein